MLQSDQLDFISSLELPARKPVIATRAAFAAAPTLPGVAFDENTDNGVVVGESAIGLTDSLSEQNSIDVMNCISLMQQGADKKFDKETQRKQWYEFYTKGLATLGWNTTNNAAQLYTPRTSEFSMDQIALEIIGAVSGGGGFRSIAEKTLNGLQKDQGALNLLENNSASETFGTFQILPCLESGKGQVAMVLNCLEFKKQVRTKRVLFFKFKKTNVTIYRAASQVQLNTNLYARIRNSVEDKLAGGAENFLEPFEI
ncbi:hypothetical protein [Pseudomonas sp. 2835]|uniref:hypothetical protein n=1 Tax=Pseudomonas sp. 2835 TaxID=3156451 RepID=UPI003D22D9D1